MTYDLIFIAVPYLGSAFFETIFSLLVPCNDIIPYMTITLCVCFTINLSHELLEVGAYNKCMHIHTSEHPLPLASDWPHAGEYRDVLIRHLANVHTTHYSSSFFMINTNI